MTTPIYNMADTWNSGGTVFTSILMNVTNTASAAGSKVLDLKVGGISQFNVDATAGVSIAGALNVSGVATLPSPVLTGTPVAPTAGVGVNTTQIATTAFVVANLNATLRPPEGRLTLTTGVPVLRANATAQGTIYYTPYIGSVCPIYNGTNWTAPSNAELSVVLDATNFLSGKLYDLFVFNDGGTVRLGYGPAWTNTTTRSGAISQLNGIWTNSGTMTMRYDSSHTVSVAANQGTYVGTAYATANGQTGMNFNPAASANPVGILGVFNAYNRVPIVAYVQDNTASWTYGAATWRAANGSGNSIQYVDGLQQLSVMASYGCAIVTTPSGTGGAYIGINLDSTSATPTFVSGAFPINATNAMDALPVARGVFLAALGLHTVNAVEATLTTTAQTYYGSGWGAPVGQSQVLSVELSM